LGITPDKKDSFLKRIWRRLETIESSPSKEEIYELLDKVEERGFIDEDEGDMIHNVLVLKDTTVREIMVPKADMIAVDKEASLDELVRLFLEKGCARIPVFEQTMDNILGVVHAKDLLRCWADRGQGANPCELMRPAYCVPESKRLTELLKEFKKRGEKQAIIIDEFGNVSGLVALSDVLAEIVGDFNLPEGQTEPGIVRHEEGVYAVDPRTPVDEFNEFFESAIPDGDYDTIGGFVTYRLERIPKPGETLEFGKLLIEVAAADKKRINKLLVRQREAGQS